jgi:hypothetical protein
MHYPQQELLFKVVSVLQQEDASFEDVSVLQQELEAASFSTVATSLISIPQQLS